MTHRLTTVLFAATFAALPLSLAAQEGGAGSKPGAVVQDDKGKKNDGFAVVQVGDEMKVLTQTDVDTTKKQIQDDFQKALAAWQAAKKAAEDKKAAFDKPEPKPTAFHVVKGGFKTQAEADTFLASEKAKTKGGDKEKEKPKEKEKGKGPGGG